EDGIRDFHVTGVQTCALPICPIVGSRVSPALQEMERGDEPGRQGRGLVLVEREQHALARLRHALGEACVGREAIGGVALEHEQRSEERRVGRGREAWWRRWCR